MIFRAFFPSSFTAAPKEQFFSHNARLLAYLAPIDVPIWIHLENRRGAGYEKRKPNEQSLSIRQKIA